MFIGNFGTDDTGRARLIVGITPQDLVGIIEAGGNLDLNEHEDPDDPLPACLMLMLRDSDEEVQRDIEEGIERAKEATDGQDDERD